MVQNTAPGASPGAVGEQAVALRLSGDKAMLYQCNILGSQDTLFDHSGRHYFFDCYIQGSIDFIFGDARSLYQVSQKKFRPSRYLVIYTSRSRSQMFADRKFSYGFCVSCREISDIMISKQNCRLHAVASTYGAIAASQRDSPSDDSGFSFLSCRITGSGMNYLGRAWGRYARVVYSYCEMDGIIIPEGWSDWGDPSRARYVLIFRFY